MKKLQIIISYSPYWFNGCYFAHDDNYDGAPDDGYQCSGKGKTIQEAIDNFLENYEDHFNEPLINWSWK